MAYSTPTIEKHVVHEEGDSSIVSMTVLLLVALVGVGFFLFMAGAFPFSNRAPADDVQIDIEGDLPALPPTNEGSTAE